MNKEIIIKTDLQHRGYWIKINIPAHLPAAAKAIVSSPQGEILKTVMLEEGNNAIDVSGIAGQSVNIKVETAYETILKNIQLSDE